MLLLKYNEQSLGIERSLGLCQPYTKRSALFHITPYRYPRITDPPSNLSIAHYPYAYTRLGNRL